MTESRVDRAGIRNTLFIILGLFLLLYYSAFMDLVQVWSTDEDYSHGFFILPISLYLVWRKREEILASPRATAWWGYALMALWAVMYSAGVIGQISTVMYLSMLLFPLGACAIIAGGQVARIILFPTVFMIFMFPIPSEIYTRVTNPLMLISTDISFKLLSILGTPILQEGNILSLPNYTMRVVVACSGIRSLMMIMALTLLIGYSMLSSNLIRMIFFFVSIPIAIIGNIFRITVTALIAYHYSPEAADGFSHTLAGLFTFALSFLLLFLCMELILWYLKRKEPSSS